MLLGNYSQNNANPGRNIGGASNPWDWMKVSNVMKFYCGDAIIINTTDRSSFNNGYTGSYGWVLSPKAGGMAMFNGAIGTGTITPPNLAGGVLGVSDISGTGTVTVDIKGLAQSISNLVGSSTLTVDIAGQLNMVSSLVGTGDLTGALGALVNILANLTGTSTLDATGLAATFISASLNGTGNLVGDITALMQILSNLSGTSTLTANGIPQSIMASALSGNGSLVGNIYALGLIISELQGIGALTGQFNTATGNMSADISAIGDLVTPESVASAVWASLLSQFTTSGTMGEVMNNMGAIADPWSTTLPGAYGVGTAGEIVGNITPSLSSSEVADAVWNELKTSHITAESYGKIVQDLEILIKQVKSLTAANL